MIGFVFSGFCEWCVQRYDIGFPFYCFQIHKYRLFAPSPFLPFVSWRVIQQYAHAQFFTRDFNLAAHISHPNYSDGFFF